MKILSWNCQGLSKPKAVRALRLLLKDNKPDVIFICEVKILLSSSISKVLSDFSLKNHSFVPPIGFAGGLLLAWTDNISLSISLLSPSFIHALINHDPNSPDWYFTGIHCPCNPSKKARFWNCINDLHVSSPSPWLIMGDFNSIISQTEKVGGLPFASSSSHDLASELNNLGLIDLGFNGNPFTWNNKRTGLRNIQQRIDRGVANSDWLTLFPHASITHLPIISSDHAPLLLNTSTDNHNPKPFRFEDMWLDDKACFDIVHQGWNIPVSGSPSFKLHSKIKNVKTALKAWNSNDFGNCHKKVKEIKDQIISIQNLDKTDINLALDASLQVELDIWLHRIETLWMQKSKDKWLKDGDANTRFFHLTAIIHARNNRIISIKNMHDLVYSDRLGIGNCFINFYNDLFLTDFMPDYNPFPENLDELCTPIISTDDNAILRSIPSADFIKKDSFQLC